MYILIGQKFIKMPKMANFGDFLKTWSLRSKNITKQVTFNRQKMVEKAKIEKIFGIVYPELRIAPSGNQGEKSRSKKSAKTQNIEKQKWNGFEL